MVPGVWLGAPEAVTIALQIVCSLVTIYFVYRTAQLLFDSREAAVIAALLYALEIESILYCSALLSETLFTCLLTSFVCFLLTYLKKGRWLDLSMAAVFLAASAYVRPIAYPLPFVGFLLILVLSGQARNALRQRTVAACAFLLLCGALLLPWHVRNAEVAGFRGFSSAFETSLYYYHETGVKSAIAGVPYHQAVAGMPNASYGEMRRSIFSSISAHPVLFAWLQVKGAAWTALAPTPVLIGTLSGLKLDSAGAMSAGFDKAPGRAIRFTFSTSRLVIAASLAMVAMVVLYYVLVLRAVFACAPSQRGPVLAVLLVAACMVFLGGGQLATGRFRHPAMPLVCMVAAAGAIPRRERGAQRRSHARGAAVGTPNGVRGLRLPNGRVMLQCARETPFLSNLLRY